LLSKQKKGDCTNIQSCINKFLAAILRSQKVEEPEKVIEAAMETRKEKHTKYKRRSLFQKFDRGNESTNAKTRARKRQTRSLNIGNKKKVDIDKKDNLGKMDWIPEEARRKELEETKPIESSKDSINESSKEDTSDDKQNQVTKSLRSITTPNTELVSTKNPSPSEINDTHKDIQPDQGSYEEISDKTKATKTKEIKTQVKQIQKETHKVESSNAKTRQKSHAETPSPKRDHSRKRHAHKHQINDSTPKTITMHKSKSDDTVAVESKRPGNEGLLIDLNDF